MLESSGFAPPSASSFSHGETIKLQFNILFWEELLEKGDMFDLSTEILIQFFPMGKTLTSLFKKDIYEFSYKFPSSDEQQFKARLSALRKLLNHFLSNILQTSQLLPHNKILSLVKKCKPSDVKEDRTWCIYKHNEHDPSKPRKEQPKGFPKTFETEEDAKHFLKIMQMFK